MWSAANYQSIPPQNRHTAGDNLIQPKLKIGASDDKYEQEADRIADKVMRMPDNQIRQQPMDEEEEMVQMQSAEEEEELQMQPVDEEEELLQMKQQIPGVQKMCPRCQERYRQGKPLICPECSNKLQMKPALQSRAETHNYASPQIRSQLNAAKGQGSNLPDGIQREMSQKFGANFSDVKVHTDSRAVQLNRSLSAQAVTYGNDIYFNQGQFAPGSNIGEHLLAHELAHVVQQNHVDTQIALKRKRKRKRKRKKIWQVRRPSLSLYQDTGEAAGRFFNLQARKKARQVRSVKFTLSPTCPTSASFGTIPYKSGADIIEAIAKAYWCTGRQVKEVHIFGHSGSTGLYGVGSYISEYGLYSEPPSAEDQKKGGRAIADIPFEAFADDIIIILHGCSTAAGDDSFAEKLLKAIINHDKRLEKARVFGHSMIGMCGRNKDWKEFSRRHQEGRSRRKIPFGLKNP